MDNQTQPTKKITQKSPVSNFRVTRAGYMYRDNKRISDRPVNPLWYPSTELTDDEVDIVRAHNSKYWRMV